LNWPDIWNASPEKSRLLADIKTTRKTLTGDDAAAAAAAKNEALEYAADTNMQIKYVFRRMANTYWRLPQYNFGRVFMMLIFALLNGFSFFKLDTSKVDLQSRVFVIFQLMVMATLLVNMVQPRFHMERQWYYRELAGKYYGWKPFALSIMVIEVPYLIFSGTIFFVVFYWTCGFVTDSVLTFYSWLMIMIFCLFAITLGQLIAALTPSTTVAALLNPFIFSALNLFCGVMMPYAQMPKFWRSWMYWLDPYHYVIEGLVTAQLHNIPVICASDEYSIFHAPIGQTCGQYAAKFLETATGYINNPNATDSCQYCQYSVGDDFTNGLHMDFDHRWRNMGILCIYLVFNVVMVFVSIRFVRWDRR